jgi:hypothetical protein
MNNQRKSDLENLDNWDTDRIEVRQPKKPNRVVFSVAFRRSDFDRVSKYAELSGKKTSEFIREAAIEKTQVRDNYISTIFSGGSQHTSWIVDTAEMPPITVLSGFPVELTNQL